MLVRNLVSRHVFRIKQYLRERHSPPKYIGPHGCLRAGASFISWNQVPGDYLEFGVASGDSFIAAWRTISAERRLILSEHSQASNDPEFKEWADHKPRFFAFDSFSGLPGGPACRQPDYYPGAYGFPETTFLRNARAAGMTKDEIITIPGYYEKTLSPEKKRELHLSKASMIMIDCDLYESALPVLDFISDLLQQGTIIIFHDWFRFKGSPQKGEQRACAEWLAHNPQIELIEFWREGPQAVSFIVNFDHST